MTAKASCQARSSSRESSRALKKLDLAKNEVTKKSLKSLDEILEDRDEKKITEMLQEERQKNMLKAAASEEVIASCLG
ncbi:hypothetical protein THAOC_31037 [Thalassiosira oceanica]|uniref:Uncharacterized protein n=1 Tax=Thalassiosira oceanica TaxID=159749 RepID=K0R8Z1_THAOC|nr:hypothetical protein THAOC_31037 [Thalassiosira oceanica]|eukprot:EJK50033.1 hypothetical protein THAOC_31037 [Thalassiosira oceanica]